MEMAAQADIHAHKTVLKSKRLVESGLLPSYVQPPKRKEGRTDEENLAWDNVAARLYNTKPVKENMSHIMTSIYAVAGLPNPATAPKDKGKKQEASTKPVKRARVEDDDQDEDEKEIVTKKAKKEKKEKAHEKEMADGVEPAWEGFDSGSGSEADSEEDFSRYDALLGGSSDEESEDDEDEEEHNPFRRPSEKAKRTIKSRGISVSISGSDGEDEDNDQEDDDDDDDASDLGFHSDLGSHSVSESESEASTSPKPSKSKKLREPPKPLKPGSQFLPTLMGGYWSGSEESASDIEDIAPAPRKNRPGQQARRAIWEKKFGTKAKHLVEEQAAGGNRDRDWDAQRGARGSDARGSGRGRGGRMGAAGGFGREREGRRPAVTGENATELGERKRGRGRGKKDDEGKLHPSWVAAKKAKDEKKVAKFEGKKVVFD
jgi:hypothetical protein